MERWHVWTISQNKHIRVLNFLAGLLEVSDYLYPTVEKEYKTKTGKKFRDVPLYTNYIFIKYNHCDNTILLLKSCMWVKDYIGICSEEEISDVRELMESKYDELLPASTLSIGHRYKLSDTIFKGMDCILIEMEGDKLVVSVHIFGDDRLVKCTTGDLHVER